MEGPLQIYKTGELQVTEAPPQLRPGWVRVRNAHSGISAGTEKTREDTARKSLLGKGMARSDLLEHRGAAARQLLYLAWPTHSQP